MELAIPLRKMTTADKLRAIEEIWNDLQCTPDIVPSPHWHSDILSNREHLVNEGKLQFTDWDEAKRRILERL